MTTTKSSAAYTDVALETFYATTPADAIDVFVLIDNDSDHPYQLKREYPKLRVVSNPSPLSFSANANQALGFARVGSADLFFLNNDLVFTDGWINPLISVEPWILSPLSNREAPYSTESFHCGVEMNLKYYLENRTGLAELTAAHRASHSDFLNMLVVPFFCIKLPFSVYSKVGLFNEQYGKGGGEDFDYCLRAIQAGFAVKYAAQSFVLHFGGKSSWSGAETRNEQLARETQFFSYFEATWGKELAALILRDEKTVISANPELSLAVKAGDFPRVIEHLRPKDR